MKNKIFFTYIFVFVALSYSVELFAQQGMQFFKGNWQEVLAEAKKQNKPIFLDCFTTWCGPCKKMAADIFPQAEVGNFYNANFVNYKLDMEKGEGPELANKYLVEAYPTFLYFDPNGELVHKTLGSKTSVAFIKDGEDALDPSKRVYGMINRFKNGDNDTAFLYKLLDATEMVDAQIQKQVLETYFRIVPLNEMWQTKPWKAFMYYDRDFYSARYRYLTENKAVFEKELGKEEVEKAIYGKAIYAAYRAAEAKDDKLFKDAKKVLDNSESTEVKQAASKIEVAYYKNTGEHNLYVEKLRNFVKNYAWDDYNELNNAAWNVYLESADETLLQEAENWAERSINLKKEYANLDTYASLLFKNGKYKQAEKAAKDAIKQAKKEGADATATEALLEDIRIAAKRK